VDLQSICIIVLVILHWVENSGSKIGFTI